jgi:anti-sigma regulatory factor (Ser/Thr protein kinase)
MVPDSVYSGAVHPPAMESLDPDMGREQLAVIQLPRDPSCAALARRFVRVRLRDVPEVALERVQLTASELATNALKHGHGAIELRMARLRDRVRVEVVDEGSGATPAISDEPGRGGGWGLRIVDELALRWGCFEGTTHVWVELALD